MGNGNGFLNKTGGENKMKKVFCALLAALTLLAAAVVPAYAVDSSKSYLFELSIDGSDTKHAAAGDIVTVLLTLKRTDKDEGYTMYAMQDEICYDPAFFELVQGSAMSAAAIETTDISLRSSAPPAPPASGTRRIWCPPPTVWTAMPPRPGTSPWW